MAQRRESVRLELEDAGFSTGMVKNAAATGLLERALKSLDGTTVNVHQRLSESASGVDDLSRSARDADGSINQLTGRLRVLGEVAAVLAPALAPIGGVALAGIGGLANQLGIAAVAGGVLIGSMQGLGDALGAMNKAQLEPTAKNLKAAEDAFKRLSPAARDFAQEAFDLKPALVALRDLGAEELFPGLTASLDSLEDLGPRVGTIMQAFAGTLGDIAADSSASLASDRWADFFEFIETEGPTTLRDLATTVGDLTHGLVELWQAFQPLNSDFSSWLMSVADGFDGWASGLAATEGFQEFIDYVRTTGPQVADTLGAMLNAVVQLVQASAPLGGPVLAGVEAFSKAVGTIADSDLGTPIMVGVGALALLNRTLAVTASLSKVSLSSGIFAGLGTVAAGAQKGSGSLRSLGGDLGTLSRNYLVAGAASERMAVQNKKALDSLKGTAGAVGPAAALVAGLAVTSTGAADSIGLTNTASLALMGTMAGPWGAAVGAGAGLLLDWKAAGDQATASMDAFRTSLQTMSLTELNAGLADLRALQAATGDDFLGADLINDQITATRDQIEVTTKLAEAEAFRTTQTRAAALAYASEVGANVTLSKWRHKSVEEIKAQADALADAREAAYKTANSFINLGDSLNDPKTSLREWINDLSSQADALNNFMTNAKTASKRGLREGLINDLKAAGVEGALRLRQLANASDEEIERANRAWRRGKKAIQDYVDFEVPPKKPKVDVSQSIAEIERLEARLRAIRDEDVNVVVRQIGSTTLGPRNENALGDFKNRHAPEIAPGGAMRVWAEPETGGESYIPHANDARRPRAKSILEQTANMFGGSVEWFAKGGTTGKDKKPKVKPSFDFSPDAGPSRGELYDLLRAAEAQADAASQQSFAARLASRAAQDQLEAAEKSESAALDNLKAAEALREGFRDSVASKFSDSLTGGGLSGLMQTLGQNVNAGSSMDATLQALVAAGLDVTGPAAGLYRELAASEDLTTANELLAAPELISMLEQQYAQRDAINAQRAETAAQNAYGPLVAQQQQQYALAQAQLAQHQAAAAQADSRSQQLSGQVTDLRAAVERQAGQLADALNSTVRPTRR